MSMNEIRTTIDGISEALVRIDRYTEEDAIAFSNEIMKKIQRGRALIIMFLLSFSVVEQFLSWELIFEKNIFYIIYGLYAGLLYFIYHDVNIFSRLFGIDDEQFFSKYSQGDFPSLAVFCSITLVSFLYWLGLVFQLNIIFVVVAIVFVNDVLIKTMIELYLDKITTQIHLFELSRIEAENQTNVSNQGDCHEDDFWK